MKKGKEGEKTGYREAISNVFYEGIFVRDEYRKNPAAAEEITQNTFVKAMTTKSEYEGSSSPYTWLCAIAKNQCYDYFRKMAELQRLWNQSGRQSVLRM